MDPVTHPVTRADPCQDAPGTFPATSTVLAADGTPIAYRYDESRTAVALTDVSPLMRKAIVAIEDARFYQHGAIDPRGVLRAVVSNSTGGGTEGASTLTQQYVKNLLVETATAAGDPAAARAAVARTPARKLREAKLAMTVERQLSKDEILQRYLNIVYFGQGSHGIQSAAMRYFDVPAAGLTPPQAALLAGLVQDPSQFDPVTHPDAARQRRDVVLADMRQQGMITPAQEQTARATGVEVTGSAPPAGCIASATSAFFCQYVVRTIVTSDTYSALGATPAAREQAPRTGGLVIRTGLDLPAQEAARTAVNRAVPPDDPSGLGTTAVTVEPGTGRVTAMVENRGYAVTAGPGRTSVNYVRRRRHGREARRPPGRPGAAGARRVHDRQHRAAQLPLSGSATPAPARAGPRTGVG
ncbi:MAG TPA: transglycosylase domain-containing protein [Kineosporiaceae bacterium]